MGNSTGNFKEYWDLFRHHERLLGGFIWDWRNQGLGAETDDGEPYTAYGGDLGDPTGANNFNLNDIAFADDTPQPAYWEVQKVQQPVHVEAVDLSEGIVEVANRYDFTNLNALNVRWVVLENGTSVQDGTMPPSNVAPGDTARVQMPDRYSTVTWYGRGPHESYADRKTGAALSMHTRSVQALDTDYPYPQENGTRTDVRWVAFTDSTSGTGLMALGRPHVDVSAWPYTQTDLKQADHTYDRPVHTVNLDYGQMGVGGNTSWDDNAAPLPEYRLTDSSYTYEFVLRPYSDEQEPLGDVADQPVVDL